MLNVWIAATIDSKQRGQGAWMCPDLELYGLTIPAVANGRDECLRNGLAMAVMSAINGVGANLCIHAPKSVDLDWLLFSDAPVVGTPTVHRLNYRTVVIPSIYRGDLKIRQEDNTVQFNQLINVLNGKEAPKGCTRYIPPTSTK